MRTIRVISLLFSLGQFILLLKIIELVRGEESESQEQLLVGRSFDFFTSNKAKQKRYRKWDSARPTENITSSTTGQDVTEVVNFMEIDKDNVTNSSSSEDSTFVNTNVTFLEKADIIHQEESSNKPSEEAVSRYCPGCVGGCGSGLIEYGLPVIPWIVAIAAGTVWFIAFLFIWYFAIGYYPVMKGTTMAHPSGGYADTSMASYGYAGGVTEGYGYGYGAETTTEEGFSILNLLKGFIH